MASSFSVYSDSALAIPIAIGAGLEGACAPACRSDSASRDWAQRWMSTRGQAILEQKDYNQSISEKL